MGEPVIRVTDFSLGFPDDNGKIWPAVRNLSMEIREGEMAALIGESGCGKTMTALSMIGLQPDEAKLSGQILFEGKNLLSLRESAWEKLRGEQISMVFQEPMTALNPLIKVGKQIEEAILEHHRVSKKEAKKLALAQMQSVGLADVEHLAESYPYQLSGGQRQRIVIAMAFVNRPKLLIADEPTTALDVTIQAQIMQLMKKMNRETKSAVLLISHNLGLVRSLCRYVYIMYAGAVMEAGPVEAILSHPLHPYTVGLVGAIPGAAKRGTMLTPIPGTVPGIMGRPKQGCMFADRCKLCKEACRQADPPCHHVEGRRIFCHCSVEELENAAGREEAHA